MVKPKVPTVLWMVFAWMLSMPVMAEEAKKSPSPLVEMSVSPARIDWHPAVDAQRWILTVSGPDELFLRREIKRGKAPFLNIIDSEGDRLPNGLYAWELKAVSKGPAESRRESGSFSIQDGSFVEALQGEDAPKPPLVSTTAKDLIENGNLVVKGRACIGGSCSNSDANIDVLKLKATHPAILFDEVGVLDIASLDWALLANPSDTDQFSIASNDGSSTLTPFTLTGGAPDNSLFVSATGKVGLGTASPDNQLHVTCSGAGETCTKVENSSATGFSGFEFTDEAGTTLANIAHDNSGNTFRFNVINNEPMVFLTNSSERMRVTSAGNVGIGTTSPGSKLDIEANAAASESARVTNLNASGFSGFSYFDESTTLGLFIGLDNANNATRINSVNNNPIVILTNGTERLRFPAPGGNYITAANGAVLTAGGVWQDASSREAKRDIVELSGSDALEALQELNPVTFRYKAEPDEQYAGFIAEDLPDLVATNDHKHLSSTDVVAVLTKVVQDQQKTITELSARLADMEALLAASRPQK
jgi:hypothetical protein